MKNINKLVIVIILLALAILIVKSSSFAIYFGGSPEGKGYINIESANTWIPEKDRYLEFEFYNEQPISDDSTLKITMQNLGYRKVSNVCIGNWYNDYVWVDGSSLICQYNNKRYAGLKNGARQCCKDMGYDDNELITGIGNCCFTNAVSNPTSLKIKIGNKIVFDETNMELNKVYETEPIGKLVNDYCGYFYDSEHNEYRVTDECTVPTKLYSNDKAHILYELTFSLGSGFTIPDTDNDKILDMDDKCVNEPETYNDWEDEDGCPDIKPDCPAGASKTINCDDGTQIMVWKCDENNVKIEYGISCPEDENINIVEPEPIVSPLEPEPFNTNPMFIIGIIVLIIILIVIYKKKK